MGHPELIDPHSTKESRFLSKKALSQTPAAHSDNEIHDESRIVYLVSNSRGIQGDLYTSPASGFMGGQSDGSVLA